MAELESKKNAQEPQDIEGDLGLDEDDGMDAMPTDEEIAAMMGQVEPDEEPDGPADREDDSNILSFPGTASDPEPAGSAPVDADMIKETIDLQAECPFCHNPIFITAERGVTPSDAEQIAGKFCKCAGAKLARQGSTLGRKIDLLFGPASSSNNGFVDTHTPAEVEIIKTVGLLVAERKVKGVTVTLENGDKAVILVVKDTTKVRRTKTTKAEMEA